MLDRRTFCLSLVSLSVPLDPRLSMYHRRKLDAVILQMYLDGFIGYKTFRRRLQHYARPRLTPLPMPHL
jgi:hypothetical protein